MLEASRNDDYEIDSDLARMDLDRVHHWLSKDASAARLGSMHLKRTLLSTLDAHEVYARAGIVPMPNPERLMILGEPDN